MQSLREYDGLCMHACMRQCDSCVCRAKIADIKTTKLTAMGTQIEARNRAILGKSLKI